jgi:hypothetical protein
MSAAVSLTAKSLEDRVLIRCVRAGGIDQMVLRYFEMNLPDKCDLLKDPYWDDAI